MFLGLARAAIRLLPFRMIAAQLGERMAESSEAIPVDGPPRRVAWAIGAAARRTPWRSKCLEQAIAGKLMLRRRGVPSTMYMGVSPGPVTAHAWLRVGSDVVLGGRGAERFTVVASFADTGHR